MERTIYRVQIGSQGGSRHFSIDTFDRVEADVWLARMLYHLRELLADEPDYLRSMTVEWREMEWKS